MRGVILIGGAAVLILALGVAGYALGNGQAPTASEAAEERDAARAAAFEASREDAAEASFERGRRDGLAKGEAEGQRAGAQRGRAAGATDAGAELAAIEEQEAAAAGVEGAGPEAGAEDDPAFEDDGGAYDPDPPPAGSYSGFEEFCADQPEEPECGGAGDPEEADPCPPGSSAYC